MKIKYGATVGLACMAVVMLGAVTAATKPGAGHLAAAPGSEAKPAPTPVAPLTESVNAAPVNSEPVRVAMASPVMANVLAAKVALAAPEADCDDRFELAASPNPAGPNVPVAFRIIVTPAGGEQLRVARASWYVSKQTQADPFDPYATNVTADMTVVSQPGEPLPPDAFYTYTGTGTFDIAVVIRWIDLADPGTSHLCQIVNRQYLEVAQIPTASFAADDLLADQQALVPLNDWVPLFAFKMSYPEASPAPRTLVNLSFMLTPDRFEAARPYDTSGGGPTRQDILEFGLFIDYGPDGPDKVLDLSADPLFLTWDGDGYPYEIPEGIDATGNYVYSFTFNPITPVYNLDFTFDAAHFPACGPTAPPGPCYHVDAPFSSDNPRFPQDQWVIAGADPYIGYIVAVRMSSSWRNAQTLSYLFTGATMYRYYTDFFTGELVIVPPGVKDSYSPQNYSDLAKNKGFSSSFEVFDLTGWDVNHGQAGDMNYNRWNYQVFKYTPVAEHLRPRWDIGNLVLDRVGGEWIDIRRLFSVENWFAALGITAHGSGGQPSELNIVCTDIGGDPFGPPGNGGFDPTEGLDTLTTQGRITPDFAINYDYTFNGIWMWHDTNNDGVFNVPTQDGTAGVSFAGDYPMNPAYYEDDTDMVEVHPVVGVHSVPAGWGRPVVENPAEVCGWPPASAGRDAHGVLRTGSGRV